MPYCITKDDENTKKARQLAEEDNRSVSNYIEILVKRDYKQKKGDDER